MSNPKIKFVVTPPPDADVENSDASYTDTVASGGLLILPDQTIEVNTVNEGAIPSVGTIEIDITDGTNPVTPNDVTIVGRKVTVEVPSGGGSPSGVLLQFPKGQQRVSFRTGDEGWRVQNGWFDYTPPAMPAVISELDYTNTNHLFVLKNDIKVKNTTNKTRFVDVLGGQAFSSTNNTNLILVDKLTGLGYYRTDFDNPQSWNDSIDAALALSVTVDGVIYDEWYMMCVPTFLSAFYYIYKQNGVIDASSSVNIYPTLFTGGTINIALATTSISAPTTSAGIAANNTSYASRFPNDPSFGKTSTFRRYFVTKQTMNLITAP
jgi:hypothetical protein